MKKSLREIKSLSKERIRNNFGDAFFIVFVPFFMMYALTIIFGQITMYLPEKLETTLDIFTLITLTIVSSFITINLLLKYVRGKDGIDFDHFFHFDKSIINYGVLRLLIAGIFILIIFPIFPLLRELHDNLLLLADANAMTLYLQESDIINRITDTTITISLLLVAFWLLTVRLQFMFFVIADEKRNIIEAFKRSLQITKGHYFKILLFPFMYVLWIILCITFFALFWVIPLIICGYGYLYITLKDSYDEEHQY